MLHKNTTSLVNLTIFMVFLASFQVAATPFIAEATIEFDNQQYTIPYYQSYLPENGSDQVVLALPYELFYVKQDGKFVTELPRLTAAKLYEVSYHLAYFYMRSPSDRVQQQLEVASEYYFALLEEGIANESRKLALRSAFAVGSTAVAVGLTCVGTAVPTLGAGCAVAVTFAAGSGVTSVWTTLASKRSALERNELLMAVVSQFVADGRAFFDTDEFDQFHELYNDLISNRPISFENIDGMMQSLMLNDIKTFASAEVILELPQPDGLHFNKEVFLGLVSLGSAALPSSGAYKAVGTIANVLISGGLGVYGVIDDKNSRGEEITSADIQEQFNLAFESANLTLPVYFSDSRLGRHGTLLSQFSGEKISTSPSVSSTSVGSQVRLKFIDLPEGYQLSIRNGLNTWKYTTPASGDLFPVVTAGSENDLFWQLQSPDGELHIAEKKIGLTVSTTTTRNVYASGLSNGVKVGWNGLPIGYDGVLVCMSENLSAVPGNLNEPATLPTGICATSDWQVKGVKASSSGSFDFTGLKQAQVYQFSVYSYDKVPAEYNSDGELVRAAYFRFSDAVQVEARTDINGILSTVDWPASGFHPYRITGELIIPSNDTFTWQDNADFNKLTIAPDTTIHLTGTGSRIVVYGELIADALDSSNDIVFTSDDSSPQPGNWGYIQFKSGSKGVLDSVQIEYGGNGDSVVFFDGGNASLIRSTIKHINGSGVSFRYETLSTLQQSTITHVSKYAVNAAFNGTTTPTRSYGVSNNYLEGTLGATFLGSSASGAFPVVSGNNTFTVEPTINSVRVSDYTFTQNSEIFRDLVFYGSLTIPSNVELDIYQGVTLFGANRSSRIVVSGQLNMHGHPSNPVTVSSVKTKPAAGDWGYVQFVEGSTGSLKNVIMEYGGDDNYSSYFTNSLGVGSAHQGAVSAILVVESSPTLENVYLRHIADVSRYNNDANNPKAAGVWFRGNAAPSINDLTVEYSESYGVYAQSTVTGAYSIDKLNVSHAGDYGIYISGTGAYALGSIQLNSNVKGGYWNPLADSQGRLSNYTLTGDTTDSSALFITGQLDVNFTATDNIKLFNATTIGTDSSLTINPDIQVYGYDRASRLIVKGELIASGSAAKPITFTSDNETPAAGDWGYVQFAEGSRGSLKNVIMEYGGDDNYSSYSTNSLGVGSAHQGVVSAILVVESSPTLENVYLRHIADVSRY
ncbi:hypothetical protein, partial [Paraglaciecola sp. 25GB23A]|uniref:hypothetical protein n=1 Tax=Paraglaciecola sp. 25GB23A TaxID=3156068 RepID=UPI0032AECF67